MCRQTANVDGRQLQVGDPCNESYIARCNHVAITCSHGKHRTCKLRHVQQENLLLLLLYQVANVRLHGGDGNRPCCFVDFDHPDDVSTVLAMREVQLLGHTVLLKPAATAATASEGPRFKPAGE